MFDLMSRTFIATKDGTQIKQIEKQKKREEERPSLLKRMFSRGSTTSPTNEEEKVNSSSDSDSDIENERSDPEP